MPHPTSLRSCQICNEHFFFSYTQECRRIFLLEIISYPLVLSIINVLESGSLLRLWYPGAKNLVGKQFVQAYVDFQKSNANLSHICSILLNYRVTDQEYYKQKLIVFREQRSQKMESSQNGYLISCHASSWRKQIISEVSWVALKFTFWYYSVQCKLMHSFTMLSSSKFDYFPIFLHRGVLFVLSTFWLRFS